MGDLLTNFLAARATFGGTLMFHIIFASLGVVMPFMILVSQWLYLRRGDKVYLALNKKWTNAFAVTYAIGAVSGTVLTFGFGLLWPNFMNVAGPVMGYPLAIEVLFFLVEAIFLGIYVFGRDQLSPWLHWISGIPIFVGGLMSMIVVVLANSWMNTPAGFTLNSAGEVVSIDLVRAMFSPAWFYEASHMTIAAFEAVAFAFAAVYAVGMLRGRRDAYHRRGLMISMIVATIATPVMIISGDLTAKGVAHEEPAKLAAMEPQFETERGAPLSIGGYPDVQAGEMKYDLEIPYMISILAFDDPNAPVQGLNDFPANERPDPRAVWWAFDSMVGIGFALVAVVAGFWLAYWRGRGVPTNKWILRSVGLSGFLGFLAIELGWITTELGRQPWIIKGVMRTAEGVTPVPGLGFALVGFMSLYVVLGTICVRLLLRMATGAPPELQEEHGGEAQSPQEDREMLREGNL